MVVIRKEPNFGGFMSNYLQTILKSDLVQLLIHKNYLYFILSVVFSQVAINMMNVVFIFLVFDIQSSNFLVSLLILTFIIPQITLSFIGGVVADLKDKKFILGYGNIIRAFSMLILLMYPKSVILIYIVSLIVSIVTQFYIPAESPMIPRLVPGKLLTAANSLFGIALFGSILIGYIVAGPVITSVGKTYVFPFMSVLFLVAAVFIALIPKRFFAPVHKNPIDTYKEVKSSVIHELFNTYKMLYTTRGVLASLLLISSSQIIVLVLATIVPGYAKTILEVPSEDLSIILFTPAAMGMIVSSLLIASMFRNSKKNTLMTVGLFLSAIVFCLFPATSKLMTRQIVLLINSLLPAMFDITKIHFAIFLSFIAGFANALIFVPSQTIIQERIPENFRSKVYGLLFAVVGVFSLLPVLLTGGIADLFGVGTVLFVIGVFIALVGTIRLSVVNTVLKKLWHF